MPSERQPQELACDIGGLVGGMNISVPPNRIGENEAVLLQNYEYRQGIIRTRQGYAPIINVGEPIRTVIFDDSTNGFLMFGEVDGETETANIYFSKLDDVTPKLLGKTTGKGTPRCVWFGNKVIIASGGKLQVWDYETLKTIDGSFLSDNLWIRDSRLGTSKRGDDNIRYSSTGDCTSEEAWKEDTNVASQAQWYEIGSFDSGDIITALPLAGDLIVFKTSNLAYRVSGSVPDLAVDIVAENTKAVDDTGAFVNVGSTIVFVTDAGLQALETTQLYGNFSANELGYKINKAIIGKTIKPRVWNLLSDRRLIICPDSVTGKEFLVYQYDTGVAYKWVFSERVSDIVESQNGTILAAGNKLCRMSDEFDTDNGEPIESVIESRQYITPNKFYTRMVDAFFESDKGEGEVDIEIAGRHLKYDLASKKRVKHIYTNPRAFEVVVRSTDQHQINNLVLYCMAE